MMIDSVITIYFSPTGTTRRVTKEIAEGLSVVHTRHIDLTTGETETFTADPAGIVVIGSPVYAGRVPEVVRERFSVVQGNGAPAVVVVVYGNRDYDDALVELRDLAEAAGFMPIAAGAFIGEHSYSSETLPIAAGRPDADDREVARAFGRMVRLKMGALQGEPFERVAVPGHVPYKEVRLFAGIAPTVITSRCTRCMACVPVCPVAAIPADNPTVTDSRLCIRCCACTKGCPAAARVMDDPQVVAVARQLHATCDRRKEPQVYL